MGSARAWIWAIGVTHASVAAADDGPPGPTPPPPSFVTMDRADETSRIGIEASVGIVRGDAAGTIADIARLDVHAQYVDPHSGLGGYLELPWTIYSLDDGTHGAVGDLEIGAIYVPTLPVPGVGVVLRAGATVPTGSTSSADQAANALGNTARLADWVLAYPESTTLRIAFSPTYRWRSVFARVDLGVDVTFRAFGEAVAGDGNSFLTTHNFARANAAIGVAFGGFSIALESANVYEVPNHGDPHLGFGASWIDTGALSLRYRWHALEPYAAVVTPFDQEAGERIDAAITFGIELRQFTVGERTRLAHTDGTTMPDPVMASPYSNE